MHATWNLFAKRAEGGVVFTWLFAALSSIIYAPVGIAYWLTQSVNLEPISFMFIGGSAVIHILYFLTLQRGYRVGDLSFIYPLARGSGPLLSTLGAVALLGERPSLLALSGTALIVVSVFVLAGGSNLLAPSQRRALIYGLVTGAAIASYTLWDGFAVSRLSVPPLLLMWLSECARAVILSPYALKDKKRVRLEWQRHKVAAFVIAILSPLAYILVLSALTFTPVSYVAPVREISILIGAILGTQLLAEGDVRRRLGAACGMVLGVICLAIG